MTKKSTVSGATDIVAALSYLGGAINAPSIRAARKSLQPMLRAAKRNAPVDKGNLKKSLIIKSDGKAPKIRPRFMVGPNKDYQVGDDRPVKYSHITEFGKADGSVKGTRWMSRAFEDTKNETIEIYAAEIGPEIEKAAARKAKRKAKK